MENYTDWSVFPAVVNKKPFNEHESGTGFDLMANLPSYYEVISNASTETLDIFYQEDSILTSRFLSKDFKVVPHYGLLFSLDTKTNTEKIGKVELSTLKPNPDYDMIETGVEIALFAILVIGCICVGFEHSDVRLKRWMAPSRGLLRLCILQMFASPVFGMLFGLFEQEFARGLKVGASAVSILIELQHLYFWVTAMTFENVPSAHTADECSRRRADQVLGHLAQPGSRHPPSCRHLAAVPLRRIAQLSAVLRGHGLLRSLRRLRDHLSLPLVLRRQELERNVSLDHKSSLRTRQGRAEEDSEGR